MTEQKIVRIVDGENKNTAVTIEQVGSQAAMVVKGIQGFNIGNFDQIDLTYVASGNGAGEIETVTYKDSGSTVATLTLSYDINNNISSIIKT